MSDGKRTHNERPLVGRRAGGEDERPPPGMLAVPRTVACRAPFLVFLIHQRFSDEEEPVVAPSRRDVANGSSRGVRPCLDGLTPSTFAPYACRTPTDCPAPSGHH